MPVKIPTMSEDAFTVEVQVVEDPVPDMVSEKKFAGAEAICCMAAQAEIAGESVVQLEDELVIAP